NYTHSVMLIWSLISVIQAWIYVDALPNPSPLMGSNWGNPRRYVHMQTSSDVNNFYIEILNGHLRKTTLRSSYSKERVAILGVKSSRYLCIDALGNHFSSTVCHKEDCLFNHKLLENHRDVYYSCRTGILLNLEGIKQVFTVGPNLPQTSLFLSEKNTKRNRVVDSSDPYNMLGQTEEDEDSRGRIIYRETPQSPYADLWNVHSLNPPPSPRIINGMMG
uniref:Fibroblast growth factor 23 n=1 Tax=Oncorhynchus tshawytscha TaxID=74940 RepID=A0A8C8C1E8_ONCTS